MIADKAENISVNRLVDLRMIASPKSIRETIRAF
jgi:hypothetical protein